ncbi:hypothetical protein K525DRAFT_255226 [Schizophyllum commune Loenen D]|nr:hypothetical protein K525DRAFT_255226 [Schizophyllum commune Loenen D]
MDPLNVAVRSVPQEHYAQAIELLEKLREVLETKDEARLAEVGITRDQMPPGVDVDAVVDDNLDKCHWQLSQFKKYAKPTLIASALPNLDFVRDVIPIYTRAVALARTPGREAEALEEFEKIMPDLTIREMGQSSALWARAEWWRLLLRQGEVQKAKEQEEWLQDWYQSHPYAMPPSKFAEAVLDDGEETNAILDGIPDFGKGVVELPGGMIGGMNAFIVSDVSSRFRCD